MLKPAVFLDRDGTIIKAIERKGFDKMTAPWSLKELEFEPKAKAASLLLKKMGFMRIMATNQPDVAYGYIEYEEWLKIHNKIINTVDFDDVFMCRCQRGSGCYFRKPEPGMLKAAADKHGLDLSKSWMIGDTIADMEAGLAAGCKVILLDRYYNNGAHRQYTMPNLWKAVNFIKEHIATDNQKPRY